MKDDLLRADRKVIFKGSIRFGHDWELVLVEKAKPEYFFGLFIRVDLIFEDVVQLFKIELLSENLEQFFLELNVNNWKWDMLIKVTILGWVLVFIILCRLLDGFDNNKFTIAVKDVIELRNMSPLSF